MSVAPFDPPSLAAAVRVGATRLIDNVPLEEVAREHPPRHEPVPPRQESCRITELAEMKQRGDRIVMVTAYDMPGGRFAEEAGIDMILVGDTAAMACSVTRGRPSPRRWTRCSS